METVFKMSDYPERYRKNIRRIVNATGACAENAYGMILMTATLMDLHPEDDKVAEMILKDCGINPEYA